MTSKIKIKFTEKNLFSGVFCFREIWVRHREFQRLLCACDEYFYSDSNQLYGLYVKQLLVMKGVLKRKNWTLSAQPLLPINVRFLIVLSLQKLNIWHSSSFKCKSEDGQHWLENFVSFHVRCARFSQPNSVLSLRNLFKMFVSITGVLVLWEAFSLSKGKAICVSSKTV